MKTIKFVDIRDYDTNTSSIAAHLTEALKRIRKNKLAVDLIGDDEKSEGLKSNDPDGFADELSAGVELTYRDKNRILERARRLAERRATASGTSHLKKEEVARLAPVVAGIQLVMAKDEHWADEVAAAIHDDMPWMAKASEYAWHGLRRAAQQNEAISLRPLILNGPAGIGKSVWARSLAKALELPMADIDASKGGAGFSLVGVERGWSTALAGRPLDIMLAKRIGNPLVVVDEICKAASMSSTKGTFHSFTNGLLSLLEPVSSEAWECPYFRLQFNMSHIIWVLTANDVSRVPEPLRSRCQVIEIPDITSEQLQAFAMKRGDKMGLSPESVDAIVTAIIQAPIVAGRRISLRDVVRMLERAEMLEGRPRVQ
jgi:hypothetical protein